MVDIIGRSAWGFRQTRSPGSAPTNRRGLVLHHTVTAEWIGPAGMKRLNEMMIRMGYVCVGYTLAIDVQGTIFSGRPLNQVGGHTRGLNTTHHAVALIGNFSSKRPPRPMEQAVADLFDYGQTRNWWGNSLTGHRDHGSTACPGGAAYSRLSVYRSGNLGSGSSPSPSPSGHARRYSDSQILRRGSSGAAVRRWQQDLLDWRNDALPRFGADADFGAETEDATKRFQRAAGIAADGVVGPESREAMNLALQPVPTPDPTPKKRYNMVIYARRDSADSLSAYTVLSQHNAFAVLTHSRGEAREALKRGEDVVAVGGPAADDLPSGATKIVGSDRGDTLRKFMDWADKNL